MSSTWGERIKLSIFGGSHTTAIGVNLDGLPAGEAVDWEQVRDRTPQPLGERSPMSRRSCAACWTESQRGPLCVPLLKTPTSAPRIMKGCGCVPAPVTGITLPM